MAERVRLLAAGDHCSPLAGARGQIRVANLANFALQSNRTRAFLSHVSSNLTREDSGDSNGGEGEIRTHVPELPDHPISSRRRYDRFGTSPHAMNWTTTFAIRAAPCGARILAEQ